MGGREAVVAPFALTVSSNQTTPGPLTPLEKTAICRVFSLNNLSNRKDMLIIFQESTRGQERCFKLCLTV